MAAVKKADSPHTAAEMRSMAERAEAEAADAEALAAAARARARAIALRREAELVDVAKPAEPDRDGALAAGSGLLGSEAADAGDDGESAKSVAVDLRETPKPKLIKTKAVDETISVDADQPEVPKPQESPDAVDDSAIAAAREVANDGAVDDVPAGPDRRWAGGLRRPKLSAVAAVLAVLVSFVALGASVEMAILHKNANRERQLVAEYAAAARQGVVTLTSLDYEHANESVRNILEVSTGTFKDDFLKMSADFTNLVEQSKVVALGTVQAAAVELDSLTDNSAVVLVASTAEVTNAAGAKQDPRKYRLRVTVTREGGQIKMSRVEPVS